MQKSLISPSADRRWVTGVGMSCGVGFVTGRRCSSYPLKVSTASREIDKRKSFRNSLRRGILKAEVLVTSPVSVCRNPGGECSGALEGS